MNSPFNSQPNFEELSFFNFVSQFPQCNRPLPPRMYTVGPNEVNFNELRTIISRLLLRIIVSRCTYLEFPFPTQSRSNLFIEFSLLIQQPQKNLQKNSKNSYSSLIFFLTSLSLSSLNIHYTHNYIFRFKFLKNKFLKINVHNV